MKKRYKILVILAPVLVVFIIVMTYLSYKNDLNTYEIIRNIEIRELKAKYVTGIDRDFTKSEEYIFKPESLDTISRMIRSSKFNNNLNAIQPNYSYHFDCLNSRTNKKVKFRLYFIEDKFIFTVDNSNLKFRNDSLGKYLMNMMNLN